ncbi:tRNA-dihydrouridine synthase [Streptomyces sp. AC563]|nr:tRNA-dihydrouridine synthase [Streptomyces buecherae]
MRELLTPYRAGRLELANRLAMAPMTRGRADDVTGVPSPHAATYYQQRAGAGLLITEGVYVNALAKGGPGIPGLVTDAQARGWREVTDAVHAEGGTIFAQLWHVGRMTHPLTLPDGQLPVAPSAVAIEGSRIFTRDGLLDHVTPRALTVGEIARTVGDFASAARRAIGAGFDGVEIHGANGYLIQQFIADNTNLRTDAYGGSYENRTRFALRVVDAVRAVWPRELPVFFRISATDWLQETARADGSAADGPLGWTADDTVRFARDLHAHGVDLLDVSTGGNATGVRIPTGPGYQVPFAARVKAETDLPVAAVGKITEPEQAEKILQSGEADAVLLGRELLRDPYWAHRAARALGRTPDYPNPYSWAA